MHAWPRCKRNGEEHAADLTIDNNAVLREIWTEGRVEGRVEGRREVLVELLMDKFGVIPESALTRISAADEDRIRIWSRKALHSDALSSVFED